MSLPSPPLSYFCVVVALLLGNAPPSLGHLVGNTPSDLRLSFRSLLAAISASFSLKLSKLEKTNSGQHTVAERNIREAKRTFERQNVAELESVSQRLCDVFEGINWFDLVDSLLPRAILAKLRTDQQGMARLQAIVNACGIEAHYHDLAVALIGFITNTKDCDGPMKENEAKLRTIPNKMFVLLFYDRLYGMFEQQMGEMIAKENFATEEANRAEFALKWLKQMRKEISKRYETNEWELKDLLGRNKADLKGRINLTKSDRMEKREQLKRVITERMGLMRDRSARVEAANKLEAQNRLYRERSEQLGAAMRNSAQISRIVSEMGGTGDGVVMVVRAQIKLSLMLMRTDNAAHLNALSLTAACNNEASFSSSSCVSSSSSFPSSTADEKHWPHQSVLFQFLQQNDIVDERGGGILFDARVALCEFLTNYGYSNLDRKLVKNYTNQPAWLGSRSLVRTLRLIRPNLNAQMGRIWEYGNHIGKFGLSFGETMAKIEQIGAFLFYLLLYRSLLDQHLCGWNEKSKKALPIVYRPFMCPEEYIGYWLDQMSEYLFGKVEATKRELNRMLQADGEKLCKMERIIDKCCAQNANANQRNVIFEKNSSRKKVENYLLKFGKSICKTFSWDEASQRIKKKDENERECVTMERPWDESNETPPNGHQIKEAIALNKEVAELISR